MKNILFILLFFNLNIAHSQEQTKTEVIEIDSATLFSNQVFALHNIYFDLGKSTVQKRSLHQLELIANFLKEQPNLVVEISVHMDSRGSNSSCMSITQRRADSVAAAIHSFGIPINRIVPKGHGDHQPYNYEGQNLTEEYIDQFKFIDKNKWEILHQKNRRVEIKIISYNYIPSLPRKTHAAPFLLNE